MPRINATMREYYKKKVNLLRADGYTYGEIADILQIDYRTVQKLARESAQEFLNSFDANEEIKNILHQLGWILKEYKKLYDEKPSRHILEQINRMLESKLRILQSLGMVRHDLGTMNIRQLTISWIKDDSQEAKEKLKKIGIYV